MGELGEGRGNMINQTHFTLTTSACRNGKSGGGDKNQLGNCSVCVC